MDWHEKSAAKVLGELGTTKKGLSQSEAEERLQKYGKNAIPEKKKKAALAMFLGQFRNFLVAILIAAAAVSAFLGEALDSAAIIVIVVLNALFGFFQERKAEKTLEALKKISTTKAKVMRDGSVRIVDSADVVPGDVVILEAGDRVPADCRILEEANLRTDESVLTGESVPVEKTSSAIRGRLQIADMRNMAFSGTTAVYGRCTAAVVATGAGTSFGKIAAEAQGVEEKTLLQKKLEVLGKQLGTIIILICALVFAAGALHGIGSVQLFLTAVSLAVAAIPEGLPAIVTITLAIGIARMARRNAIIRKLPAVETLGSTTFVCADKTGTLTKNEMTVKKIYANGRIIDVTGEGYSMEGRFVSDGKEARDDGIELLLTAGVMCNNAILGKENVGDPTEIALLVCGRKYGIAQAERRRIEEIEFDSERKMMSVVCDKPSMMYSKGAVEEILKRCKRIYRNGSVELLHDDDRRKILEANSKFAESALRALAFAVKNTARAEESGMTFVGLQAMADPLRPEAKEAAKVCREAGIRVVMITGDHRNTASAVAKELGIMDEGSMIITGEELDAMDEKEFSNIVEKIVVYARVSPEHKSRITNALKGRGHVVAMTGDGINDAPALKKADIGIAMGLTGTDVAREASDMVLADDNFSSIVSAVEEGRGVYDNIRKFILYLLSCNIAEVIVVFAALMFIRDPATGAFFLPLLPLQLLWMNLVTDGLPALALGTEPYMTGIMSRKPRNPKENILGRKPLLFTLAAGVFLAVVTLLLFNAELPDEPRAQTMAFTSLVVFEMAVALSFRRPRLLVKDFAKKNALVIAIIATVALQLVVVQVPHFNPVFGTVPLSLAEWARIFLLGTGVFIISGLMKRVIMKDE